MAHSISRIMSMKTFKSFREENTKSLVVTFGRFNPPTTGHEKLITKVSKVDGSEYRIYASQSTDPKKNPLKYKDKIKFMRKMFPKHARNIILDKNVKNIFDVANKAHAEGYAKLTLVVGSDRVNEFKKLLEKYNGVKTKTGLYDFQEIEVVSAGERDPDAEGVDGMSASKMRAAASDNDLKLFASGLPRGFGEVQELFNAVRKGMGLKESFNFRKHVALKSISEKREKYAAGEIFNIGEEVLYKGNLVTIIARKPNFVVCEGNNTKYNCWLKDLKHG